MNAEELGAALRALADEVDGWSVIHLSTKEPKWYENIPPGGVRCRVSDADVPTWADRGRVITNYNPENSLSFRDTRDIGWGFATPISELEGDNDD